MGQLEAFYQESILLLEALRKLDQTDTDRDQIIQAIQIHIEHRDTLLAYITAPYSEDEIKLGKKLIILNKEIKQRMEALYTNIKQDIKQVQQRKTQNYSYMKPYGNMKTIDGMYLDRKS